jgi:hypothetical protein
MNSSWIRGNKPRVEASFKAVDGTGVDPVNLLFKWKDVEGSETIYTYGTDAELVKDASGEYHVDVPIDTTWTKGKIYCRYEARDVDGVVLAALETVIEVKSNYLEAE